MKTFSSWKPALLLATCLVFLTLPGAVLAQTAHYTVTFNTTWTALTHPTNYPSNPHFSGLVGGTHNGTITFWEVGQLASLGIKRMAEWGSQAELLAEVQTAIDAGQAESSLADATLWDVPGSTSFDFDLNPEFSLITLVGMIAPSPDWFIGVQSLDLRPGGEWAEEIVVDLYPYDAGTDSGTSYGSPDQPTNPPDPIALIGGFPFEPGVSLGTMTFTKNYVSDVPAAAAFRATAYPNPFNPRTTIAWELPAAGPLRVNIHDASGRLIRSLHDGQAQAGTGQAVWNGQDNTGRQVGAGVYFARVIQGEASLTRKITMVK